LLLAGDNILSRFPFIASVKALIADATGEPAWRRVLPPMAGLPLLEEDRMLADFRHWEASLPAPLRSLYPAVEEQESRIVALRRS
jgi:4-hydroxy-tetrahydrodipicolinate synthase